MGVRGMLDPPQILMAVAESALLQGEEADGTAGLDRLVSPIMREAPTLSSDCSWQISTPTRSPHMLHLTGSGRAHQIIPVLRWV